MEESSFSAALGQLTESRRFKVADFLDVSPSQLVRLRETIHVALGRGRIAVVFDGRVTPRDFVFGEAVNRIPDAYEVRWNGGGFEGDIARDVVHALRRADHMEDATFIFDARPSQEVLRALWGALAKAPELKRVRLSNAGVGADVRASLLDVMRKITLLDISGDNDPGEMEYLRSSFAYRADVDSVEFYIDGVRVNPAATPASSPRKSRFAKLASFVM